MRRSPALGVAAGAVTAVVLLAVGPASADPSGTPSANTRPLQGVGSDTTQNVMSDLADVITAGAASVTARQRTSQVSTFSVASTAPFQVNQIVQIDGVPGFNGTARVLSVLSGAITTTASPGSPDVALASVSGGTATVATDYPSFSVYSRTAGVATLYVSSVGSISVGDTVTVYAQLDASFTGLRTVTAVGGGTISFLSSGSDVPATALSTQGQVFRSAQKAISSWDATGVGNFNTRATNSACTYTRAEANGSGNGRSRLLESLTSGNARSGCLDFARSSSAKGTLTTTPSLTWIPFANDDSTFVVRSDGGVPRNIALADLINIYKCANVPDIYPILPQTGSGSRSFWLGQMGITETQISAGTYPCLVPVGTTVNGVAGTGRPYVQENDARNLKGDEVMPFSVGLYNTQVSGVNTDNRGAAVIGQINSTLPTGLNTSFPVRRQLFNIIPTANIGVAPWSTVFVGSSSLVCQNTATIAQNGFQPLTATSTPACGDSSSQS